MMMARIAVFESAPNILKLFALTLRPRGYEVITFPYELTTISHLEMVKPDLLILGNICDADDPEFKLVQQIKSQIQFASLPLIVVTTAVAIPEAWIISLPGIHWLPKPFDPQELLAVVSGALHRFHP